MAFGREILASLAIRLGIDTSEMKGGIAQANTNMAGLTKGIKAVGLAMAGTFVASTLNRWAKEGYDAYQMQVKNEKLLLTALKGRQDVQARLIDQAKYLQSNTLFGDNEIIEQQKMLAALGMSEMQIRNVTSAAVQLSTALGISLGEANKMLAKSFSGYTKELGRLIPAIKEMSREQLAAGGAINWVNENMTDLAETAADTSPIEKNIILWGEFKELLGKGVAPAMNAVFASMNRTLKIMTSENVSKLTKWLTILGITGKEGKKTLATLISNEESNQESQAWNQAAKEWLDAFNKNGGALTTQLSLFEKINNELEFYKQKWEDANSEEELSMYGRKIQLLEQELKRLKELGQVQKQVLLSPDSIKKSLAGMAGEMQGPLSTPYSPTAKNQIASDTKGLSFANQLRAKHQKIAEINQEALLENEKMNYEFTRAIEYMYEDMAISFAESIGTMIATGKADWGVVLNPIADAMSALGKLIIVAAIALDKLKKNLLDWAQANPGVAIAAGAALIAASTAIKAGIANIGSGGGGGGSVSMANNTSGDYIFKRNLGDAEPIRVEVIGTISGENIRLANKRASDKHNFGY